MGDVVFDPATTPLPTRLGSRQGGTDSTTDLALVSPRIAPWLSAKTPHGSDHLLVVFSLQKPATEQSIKPHTFRYERSGSGIVSKLRKRKPKKARKAHGKARSSYHGGTVRPRKAWTEKSWMGQAEDSILQVCQLTELKQTKEWERYPNRFRRLYETLLPDN